MLKKNLRALQCTIHLEYSKTGRFIDAQGEASENVGVDSKKCKHYHDPSRIISIPMNGFGKCRSKKDRVWDAWCEVYRPFMGLHLNK